MTQHDARLDQTAIETYRDIVRENHANAKRIRPTERLLLLGVESCALRHAGDLPNATAAALQFHDRALAMVQENRIDEHLAHTFGDFAYQVVVILIAGDEFLSALSLLQALEQYCRAHGFDDRRRSALSGMSYLQSLAGNVVQAGELATEGGKRAPALRRSRSHRGFLDAGSVIRAGLRADFFALTRAVSVFRHRPHESHWDILLFGEVLLDLAEGRTRAARMRFDEAVGLNIVRVQGRTSVRRASYIRAILVLFGEDPRLLASANPRAGEDPLTLAFSAGRDMDRGDTDAAEAKLTKAAAGARTPLTQHVVYTMLARLGVATGDDKTIRDASERLLGLTRTFQVRLAYALLDARERDAILTVLGSPAELREAFGATRPITQPRTANAGSVLTGRQLAVIRAIAEHDDRRHVARALALSPATVKAHLRSIYKKLDAHNQAEALHKAAALGLLDGARQS